MPLSPSKIRKEMNMNDTTLWIRRINAAVKCGNRVFVEYVWNGKPQRTEVKSARNHYGDIGFSEEIGSGVFTIPNKSQPKVVIETPTAHAS
jgi:hypothetical protein